jgi:hypothetical protein
MESIGHKLAIIHNENNSESSLTNLEFENDKLKIPDLTCSIHKSFLQNNLEFFYNYIFGSVEDKNCQKIIIHLNNCYSCFCEFSQTMREYFHTRNEVKLNAKGVAK